MSSNRILQHLARFEELRQEVASITWEISGGETPATQLLNFTADGLLALAVTRDTAAVRDVTSISSLNLSDGDHFRDQVGVNSLDVELLRKGITQKFEALSDALSVMSIVNCKLFQVYLQNQPVS
jgi:hypothetical protein